MVTINERVFQLLFESHRSQKDLADFCGIFQSTGSVWSPTANLHKN